MSKHPGNSTLNTEFGVAACFFLPLSPSPRVAELELELDQVDREIRQKTGGGRGVFCVQKNLVLFGLSMQ